jgi:transposase
MTATEAAKRLGISRKTYYQWERRGLEGMMEALGSKASGRPQTPVDEEKAQLRREVQALRRQLQLMEESRAIRKMIDLEKQEPITKRRPGSEAAKKKEPNP